MTHKKWSACGPERSAGGRVMSKNDQFLCTSLACIVAVWLVAATDSMEGE